MYVLPFDQAEAFLKLKTLLAPFGIIQFYTDGWAGSERHLDSSLYTVGKWNTQKIERQHLTLRTRIQRLARQTICFSQSIFRHHLLIGLLLNRFDFGLNIYSTTPTL